MTCLPLNSLRSSLAIYNSAELTAVLTARFYHVLRLHRSFHQRLYPHSSLRYTTVLIAYVVREYLATRVSVLAGKKKKSVQISLQAV